MSNIGKLYLVLGALMLFGCGTSNKDASQSNERSLTKQDTNPAIKLLVEQFNASVTKQNPWKGYLLTEVEVNTSIQNKLPSIHEKYRSYYEDILNGKLPESATLIFESNEQCLSGMQEKYFLPRLTVKDTPNSGYYLAVGHDVAEKCF